MGAPTTRRFAARFRGPFRADPSDSCQRSDELLDSLAAMVYESNVDTGEILYANARLREFHGVGDAADIVNISDLTKMIHPDDLRRTLDLFGEAARQLRSTLLEYRAFRDDRVVHLEHRACFDDRSGFLRASNVVVDVTERKQREQERVERTLRDLVTGLPNRSLFQDRVEHALHRSRRTATVHSVIFIDVDDFSSVSNRIGHLRGDTVLAEIGRRLARTVRLNDTVARIGGDVYALLLEDTTEEAARLVTERALRSLARPFEIDDTSEIQLTAKVGLILSTPESSSDHLMRGADAALYRAKMTGSTVVHFDVGQDEGATMRLTESARVREAIANDELILHYQPIVSLETGAVTGSEALVRWDHPVHGLLPPVDFLHVAAAGGLMGDVARVVLGRAVRQMREWDDAGYAINVNVNLSCHELTDESLMSWMVDLLDSYQVPRSRLIVELTETELLTDAGRAVAALGALRRLGICSAIDDFGTGYSSLVWLRDLPIDILKIDRSFVSAMASDSRARAIVDSTINLAKSLNLQIVAEGVETPGTAALLQAMHCHKAQGYHYSKPLAPVEFLAFIRSQDRVPALTK